MWKIYVGNLDACVRERELADAFNSYGLVRSVWIARNPPGYAFIEFNSRREADDAISGLDVGSLRPACFSGKHGWRVEMSKRSAGGHKSRSSSSESRCRECGSARHRTKDCWSEGAKRSNRRSSSPRSRTASTRYDLPRKRECSISPDEVCVKFSRNDLGNPHVDEHDIPKQHENETSPDNYRDSSQKNLDTAEGCNLPRKHEHHISPEDCLCRSPQNDQDNAHADNYNTSRQLERNISPEYGSRSQDDQDSSSDECNVPRKRERNRSPERYRRGSLRDDQGTSCADEKWENSKSPEHQYSRSPEHEGSRSPKINHNGSCADTLSPAS